MPRTAGDGEAQRDQILTSAVELLAEHGAASLRLRDVAKTAGVSVGMIQYYFDGRDRLVEDAFRRYSEDVIARLHVVASSPGDPWHKLTALCEVAAGGANVHRRSTVWLNLVDTGIRDTGLRGVALDIYEAWVDAFHQLVRDGCERGSFRDATDPVAVAEQLVAIVDGLDVASAIQRRGVDGQRRLDLLLATARALLEKR